MKYTYVRISEEAGDDDGPPGFEQLGSFRKARPLNGPYELEYGLHMVEAHTYDPFGNPISVFLLADEDGRPFVTENGPDVLHVQKRDQGREGRTPGSSNG